MKLFFCSACWDVVKMNREKRFCECKKSSGHVEDSLKNICGLTKIEGLAIPLAMDNNYILWAAQNWLKDKRTVFIQTWTVDTTTEKCDV